MKKIGISTVYTGYNYGSALQAYATKYILKTMGYDGELIRMSGSLFYGRDIRIKKLITIVFRAIFHSGGLKNLKNYGDSVTKILPEQSATCFNNFYREELKARTMSYRTLKKEAYSDKYDAFLCGSDQIWNSAVFYVDPFYYLRFAPFDKRIAFAPSFGRDYVPDYNKKRIAKYISEIKYVSVREASGVDIIKKITGMDSKIIIDPTLILNADEWIESLKLKEDCGENYLLAYFLDKPSNHTVELIKRISRENNLRIVNLPYAFENSELGCPDIAGPYEFVQYIKNAKFVCTDSFHGTAFSLNFNVPFYTFERNYGNASKQSTRIESILKMSSLTERYEPLSIDNCMCISFENANSFLNRERERAYEYLTTALDNGGQ